MVGGVSICTFSDWDGKLVRVRVWVKVVVMVRGLEVYCYARRTKPDMVTMVALSLSLAMRSSARSRYERRVRRLTVARSSGRAMRFWCVMSRPMPAFQCGRAPLWEEDAACRFRGPGGGSGNSSTEGTLKDARHGQAVVETDDVVGCPVQQTHLGRDFFDGGRSHPASLPELAPQPRSRPAASDASPCSAYPTAYVPTC